MQPLQGWFGGAFASLFFLSSGLLGCGGGGDAADLVITSAAPSDAPACERSIVSLENFCAEIRLFEVRPSGERVPYRIYDPDADGVDYDAPGQIALRFDSNRPNGRRLRFDADLDPSSRYDLEVEVYDGAGEGFAGAVVEDIPTDGSDVVVRLYPHQRWACATAPQSLRVPQPRALHHAVALDDGDVLIFGGVTASDPDGGGVHVQSILRSPAAILATEVEVYDVDRHVIEEVDVSHELDGEIPGGVGRVLSGAVYLGAADASVGGETHRVHRIRVFDGVTMRPDQAASPVLGLDPSGTELEFEDGYPFVPLPMRAQLADPIDLLFDADARTMTIEPADVGEGLQRGAAVTVSDAIEGRRIGAPGFVKPPGAFEPGSVFYAVGPDGAVGESGAFDGSRLGATVTALGPGGGFVVWGGLAATGAPGGTVDPTSLAFTPLGGAGTDARAMHTATRLDSTSLLVAGGLPVMGGRILGNEGAGALTAPLAILELGAPGEVIARPYASAEYQATAFHTATLDEPLGVILVGGATTVSGNRFTPVDAVWAVRGAEVTALASLAVARWGHTATPLPGRRLLVWGGFAPTSERLVVRPISEPEVLFLEAPPAPLASGACDDHVSDAPDAAAIDPDAGRPPPVGPPPPPDAGPPPMDAGPSPDGG
ncbi:MAG: hypothetical protein VYE22_35370 [Myxococcota bacterium]|nr:hypothetical protein [Myxococcota bacterium]